MRFVAPLMGFMLLAGCGPTIGEDFDSFCRVVNEVNKERDLSTDARVAKINERKAEFTTAEESQAPAAAWAKYDAVPSDQRYKFLVDAAHAAGKAEWKCVGFEKLMVTLTVEQTAKLRAEEEAKAKAAADEAAAAAKLEAEKKSADKVGKKGKKAKKGKKKKRRG
jgi:hypothetical protein